MSLHLELWVEGPTDARTHSAWTRAEEDNEPAPSAGGALGPLVFKALAASDRVTPEVLAANLPEERVTAYRLVHKLRGVVRFGGRKQQAQLSNYAWKVLAAIDQTRRDPSTLVLAVWDRDGREEPLRDRDEIHKVLRARGEKGAAIAICVEEVEAWLLADSAAFARCFGRGPRAGWPGAPEAEPHPKERLVAILHDLGAQEDDMGALYRRIAEQIDVDVLAKRCPRGFGELRKALRELIEPCLLAGSSSAS